VPVIAWVLLVLGLLFVLLLLMPVGVVCVYERQALTVKLRLGLLKFTAFPQKEPSERQKKKQAAKAAKKAVKQAEEKPETPTAQTYDRLDLAKRMLPQVSVLLKKLGRGLRIPLLLADVRFGMGSPYQTAVWYGRAQAIVGQFWYLLNRYIWLKEGHIHLEPSFEKAGIDGEAQLEVHMRVGTGLAMGLGLGLALLRAMKASKAAYAASHTAEQTAA